MVERAVFCRNYAEELRIQAAEKRDPASRGLLLSAADEYDRLAAAYEGVSRIGSRPLKPAMV